MFIKIKLAKLIFEISRIFDILLCYLSPRAKFNNMSASLYIIYRFNACKEMLFQFSTCGIQKFKFIVISLQSTFQSYGGCDSGPQKSNICQKLFFIQLVHYMYSIRCNWSTVCFASLHISNRIAFNDLFSFLCSYFTKADCLDTLTFSNKLTSSCLTFFT